MELFVTVVARTALALLFALQVCMFVRAILSWFPIRDDYPILLFTTLITEPIVAPIRALF